MKQVVFAAFSAAMAVIAAQSASAEDLIDRGKYLVGIMGCADCHSPLDSEGGPDMSRALTGGIGFELPGLGIFWAPNLTPDETGLAAWSEAEIVTAIRTGIRPDGRNLVPVMPWPAFSSLTDEDAAAIAAYLKTLPPVENAVPAPVGPGEPALAPYFTMVFPADTKS
jgi:mono/diheme cytochrome c family protein